MTFIETSEKNPRRTLTTFTELGVEPAIADALAEVGITTPFPIQEMTLQVALVGTDLIGQARTGTGKTLAFAIPVIQRTLTPSDTDYDQLAAPGKPQALIVTPTRELTLQVAGDVDTASRNRKTRNLTVYGGVPYEPQLEALETGVDIVIGTPGRLLDLVNRGALDISHVKSLVLDEADEMLDLGFLPDIEAILSRTPETRQTMLFSATMPGAIVSLARRHMHHPMNIRAESAEATQMVPATNQFVWQAHDLDKPEIVARVLQADDVGRVIVFTRTKRAAQRLADDLVDRGFPASPLHGDMAQKAREKALQGFRDGKVNTLIATDVAARGIDVAGITHVINYTCPEDDKTYVHRIGRTGRAGASGTAVTFVDWADLSRWKLINAALSLPFEQPEETYSTSEHLFRELGIDPKVKGRLTPAAPKTPPKDKDAQKPAGGSGRSRNRNRRRTRGGVPQNSERAESSSTSSESSDSSGQKPAEGSRPRRRRRRRRSSGGGESTAGAQQSTASSD